MLLRWAGCDASICTSGEAPPLLNQQNQNQKRGISKSLTWKLLYLSTARHHGKHIRLYPCNHRASGKAGHSAGMLSCRLPQITESLISCAFLKKKLDYFSPHQKVYGRWSIAVAAAEQGHQNSFGFLSSHPKSSVQ